MFVTKLVGRDFVKLYHKETSVFSPEHRGMVRAYSTHRVKKHAIEPVNVGLRTDATVRLFHNRIEVRRAGAQPDCLAGIKRGACNIEMSHKSRKRLLNTMNDWRIPPRTKKYFITLTYPKEFSLDWRVWKAHLEAFRRKLLKVLPGTQGLWRLELQKRGAPHYHLIIAVPARLISKRQLIKQVTRWWASIAHTEDQYEGEYATQVEPLHSDLHAYRYVAKYCSKPGGMSADIGIDGCLMDGETGEIIAYPDEIPGATMGRHWGRIGNPNCDPYAQFDSIPEHRQKLLKQAVIARALAAGYKYAQNLEDRLRWLSWDCMGIRADSVLMELPNFGLGNILEDNEIWAAIAAVQGAGYVKPSERSGTSRGLDIGVSLPR